MSSACRDCGSIIAMGLRSCPNCQSANVTDDHREVEHYMSKISKAHGATRFNPDPQSYDAVTLDVVGKRSDQAGRGETPVRDSADAGVSSTEQPAYPAWTVPQLKAELDKRRTAYEAAGNTEDAEYVGYQSGDKKDLLIELLEADDEERSP